MICKYPPSSMSLYFSTLKAIKSLRYYVDIHNLKTIFDKTVDISKQLSSNWVNFQKNVLRSGAVPQFSDLEVIVLSFASEALSIDSENYLSHNWSL